MSTFDIQQKLLNNEGEKGSDGDPDTFRMTAKNDTSKRIVQKFSDQALVAIRRIPIVKI